jgi:DNA repair exonuclease SbcCD ATPase subunit
MDGMGLWLVIGAAVAIAAICVILLQKKAGEAKKYVDELESVRGQLTENNEKLVESQKNISNAEGMQGKIDGLSATLQSAKEQNSQLTTELTEAKNKLHLTEEENRGQAAELAEVNKKLEETNSANNEVEKLSQELTSLKKELEEKTREVAAVERRFEEQMDEVVQSSIQKITHAEQAKEEAIQAAQDNFEAAAEANTRLKEQEQLIKKLQS